MQPTSRSGAVPRSRIAAILLDAGLLDEARLREALAQQERWGGRLTRRIAELGFVSEEAVVGALERALRVPRLRLAQVTPTAAALFRVEAGFAEARGVLPVALRDGGRTLVLAMADPTDVATMDEVARRTHVRVEPAVAGERELEAAIRRHYHGAQEPGAPAPAPHGEAAPPPAPPADVLLASAPADSAGDVLEELLTGVAAQPEGLTAEERVRLEVVRQNQERSGRVVRALLALLLEKGALGQEELAARLRG